MIQLTQVNKECSEFFSIFFLFLQLQLLLPGYDVAQEKTELGGLFCLLLVVLDSKVSIALCRPVMSDQTVKTKDI